MLKIGKYLLVVLFILSLMLLGWNYYNQQDKTLTIDIYTDSSWGVPNSNEYKFIDYVTRKFEKQNPHVKVRYETGISKDDYMDWLAEKILKNKTPDVFIVPANRFSLLSSTGALANLTYFTKLDHTPFSKLYYPANYSAGKYKGAQYALPFESNPTLMCVNTDLLKRNGLKVPNSNWTITHFYELCRKMNQDTNHDGTIDQFGFADYDWQDAIMAYGTDLFNPSGTESYFNTSKVRNALFMMSKLYNLQNSYNVTSDDFDKGKVAFLPMTLAQYRTYESYPYHIARYSSFLWTCIRMPAINKNIASTSVETTLFGMAAHTKHPILAWKLLKMLCANQKVQQKLFETSQGASVMKSVMQSNQVQKILKAENVGDDALTENKFNNIMYRAKNIPEFKNYNNVIHKADYLIEEAIEKNTIGTELSNIQIQIQNDLNN